MKDATSVSNFAWKRVPNWHEVATINGVNSFIDLALSSWLVAFGTHPASKNIIRDLTKLPSIALLSYNGEEVGNTGYHYDSGYLAGSVVKIACKAITIWGAYAWGQTNIETTSRISNFICEVPSRFLILASMDRQKRDATEVNLFKYILQNVELLWLGEALFESFPKVFISDMLGEGVKKLGLKNIADGKNLETHQVVMGSLGVAPIAQGLAGDGKFWGHFSHYKEQVTGAMQYMICGASMLIDYGTKIAYEALISYLMMPTARIIQDLIGYFMKHQHHEDQSTKGDLAKPNASISSKSDTCPNLEIDSSFFKILHDHYGVETFSMSEAHPLQGVCFSDTY